MVIQNLQIQDIVAGIRRQIRCDGLSEIAGNLYGLRAIRMRGSSQGSLVGTGSDAKDVGCGANRQLRFDRPDEIFGHGPASDTLFRITMPMASGG